MALPPSFLRCEPRPLDNTPSRIYDDPGFPVTCARCGKKTIRAGGLMVRTSFSVTHPDGSTASQSAHVIVHPECA